ncbi:hypothetical protein [Burkholderia ubonensis]|uniref:hypothetical protein n=1 Tax=Burkholderia ubonensis TaxID=101571 RepID=UPI00211721D9|nr:hypothetical protein [Burkholderia ubonensis]
MKFSQQFFSNSFFEQDNTKLELTDLARKACFFHQDAAGLYAWMSLGLRAQRCVERVVRDEMERAGFCEVQMSLLQDAGLWRQSGRLDIYGDELIRLTNRSGRLFCHGATCEELAATLVRTHYNRMDLSLGLYQFGNKYRDELRTRGDRIRALRMDGSAHAGVRKRVRGGPCRALRAAALTARGITRTRARPPETRRTPACTSAMHRTTARTA